MIMFQTIFDAFIKKDNNSWCKVVEDVARFERIFVHKREELLNMDTCMRVCAHIAASLVSSFLHSHSLIHMIAPLVLTLPTCIYTWTGLLYYYKSLASNYRPPTLLYLPGKLV